MTNAFDDQLYLSADEEVFNLVEVDKPQRISPDIDTDEVVENKTINKYIPPSNHPWRKSTFIKHAKSQMHRIEKEIDEYYSQAISD